MDNDLFPNFNGKRAIQLDGKWGVGKTHFLQKMIFNNEDDKNSYTLIYISLFGKNSSEEIFQELSQKINKKAYQINQIRNIALDAGGKMLDRTINHFIPVFDVEFFSHLSKNFHKSNTATLKKDISDLKKEIVICFDDLERLDTIKINYVELLGVLNTLLNEYGLKCIVISNEEKITLKNGGTDSDYQDMKERIIGKTYKLTQINTEEIINSFVITVNNVELRNSFKNYSADIIKKIEQKQDKIKHNLRTIITIFDRYFYLLAILQKDRISITKLERIYYSIFDCVIASVLDFLGDHPLQTDRLELKEKLLQATEMIIQPPTIKATIKRFIYEGLLDEQAFIDCVKESYFKDEYRFIDEPLQTLNNIFWNDSFKNEDVTKDLKTIVDSLLSRELPASRLFQAIGNLRSFHYNELYSMKKSSLIEFFKECYSLFKKNIESNPLLLDVEPRDLGFHFQHELDSEYGVDLLHKAYNDDYERIQSQEKEAIIQRFIDNPQFDVINDLKKEGIKIIEDLEPEQFWGKIIQYDANNLKLLLEYIKEQYQYNPINSKYIDYWKINQEQLFSKVEYESMEEIKADFKQMFIKRIEIFISKK